MLRLRVGVLTWKWHAFWARFTATRTGWQKKVRVEIRMADGELRTADDLNAVVIAVATQGGGVVTER